MHYQIFLPRVRGCDPALLVNVGLADFVAGAELVDVPGGPDQTGPGVLVAWRKPGAVEMGYRPDAQIWLPAVPRDDLAAGRYWVGFWPELPRPNHLARPYPQPGKQVALGDGQEWLIPSAKELDADMILADDGTWRFEVQRRFHAFYLDYLKWMQFFGNAGPDEEFLFADAAEFILSGLRINYRLPPEAASHLRLFTKDNVLSSLLAVMGIERPH